MSRSVLLRWASVFFALIGLGVSIYLTYVKLTNQLAACSTIGDCESVNSSIYSEIGGIPIALLGAVAYLLILITLLLEERNSLIATYGLQIIYGVTLIGVLYSAYLTYIEIAVLRAICPYCVISAVAITLIFIFSVIRLFSNSKGLASEAQ